MAESTPIVIAVGAITLVNEAIFVPMAPGSKAHASINWRIIPATAGLALALGLLEKIAPKFAVGIAWLALATVLVVPFGNAPTPLENLNAAFGYAGKVTA